VNIPLTGVPLREELGRRLGVPVFVDNDANCAALAEAHTLGEDNLVMLTLGTGVGGGVVIGGTTFRGAHGLGAELGHFTLNPDGPPCPGKCPNRGCIEAYCSGQALERDATELARDKSGSALAKRLGADGKVSGREVVAAAEGGDPDALLVFQNFARMLGVALAGYVNVFEPDRVALGGGLSRASNLFLERAVQEASTRALPALWRRATIALAQGGADAGAIGAGVLAALEVGSDTAKPHATATERAE
jgi:glucokinase